MTEIVFFISIFYIFYQLCPLVWNIETERGKENEKVGGHQAKLNESESGRELEKGTCNLTDEQREREQERNRERRQNFTDEQQ